MSNGKLKKDWGRNLEGRRKHKRLNTKIEVSHEISIKIVGSIYNSTCKKFDIFYII